MPGFRVCNLNLDTELRNFDNSRCYKQQMSYKNWIVKTNVLNKFNGDKVFIQNENNIIVIDGVVYNKNDLIRKYNAVDWDSTVSLMADMNECFFSEFDGSFSGALFIKEKNKWLFFTSPLGEKAIFYYYDNNLCIVGSQLNYITDSLIELNIQRTPDIEALKQFMAYNCYFDDSTCIKNIKRLLPGDYLEVGDNNFVVKNYYTADYKEDNTKTENDWIEELDSAFNSGLKKILQKNAEYGYTNLVDISGGFDSRMIAYAIKSLKGENVLMNCFSQSKTDDETIAEFISSSLGYDYVFLSLDNADIVMSIDDNILMNNGATYYCSVSGGRKLLSYLDQNKLGLEITGLLGDVDDGSMTVMYGNDLYNPTWERYKFSSRMKLNEDYVLNTKELKRFVNNQHEHYWLFIRGMLFGMSSYFVRQNFTEVATPFGAKEFLKVYLEAPWELRVKNHLLRKWMIKKYPEAGIIKHSGNGPSPKESLTFIYKLKAFIRRCFNYLLRLLHYDKKQKEPNGMNDIAWWYRTNSKFHDYLNDYYENNRYCLNIPDEIGRYIDAYWNGSPMEKLLAVSVVSIFKTYIK